MIDPSSQAGRVLSLLSDGVSRTSNEIGQATDLTANQVASIAYRLNGAALLKCRREDGRGRKRKVWAITDEGRTRLLAAQAEKVRPTE